MSKKDMDDADLPKSDNASQNSQLANSIRNQSVVAPEDYPLAERNPESAAKHGKKGSDRT